MSDLTQALEDASVYGSDTWQYDYDLILAAARRVAEAPEVWWCETHDGYAGKTAPSDWGHTCMASQPFTDKLPCRMVRKLLVDP